MHRKDDLPAELRKILCADDEEDILSIVGMCLEMLEDVDVTWCKDGEDALARARETKPDLVILDVMMPRMDGPTAMREMRADPMLKDCPVILMTARVQPSEIEEYRAMGAIDVIQKPFDPMTLASDVIAIWERHQSAAPPGFSI